MLAARARSPREVELPDRDQGLVMRNSLVFRENPASFQTSKILRKRVYGVYFKFILSLVIFLTWKKHKQGFSHIERPHWKAVYFMSTSSDMEVFINGCGTGLRSPGILYFPNHCDQIAVEYRFNGLCYFSKTHPLTAQKSLVMGEPSTVLNLLA